MAYSELLETNACTCVLFQSCKKLQLMAVKIQIPDWHLWEVHSYI